MSVRGSHGRWPEALVPPLADLQNRIGKPFRGQVEIVRPELLAVEPDPALAEQPPRLRARQPEVVPYERGHVNHLSRRELRLLDLVGIGSAAAVGIRG